MLPAECSAVWFQVGWQLLCMALPVSLRADSPLLPPPPIAGTIELPIAVT